MLLEGKVALVTGGGRGMGAGHAKALAAAGARVVVSDVADDGAAGVAHVIGDAAIAAHLDVGLPSSWTAAVELTLSTFGSIDVLVNNAGITSGSTSLVDTSDEDWARVMDINLTGAFYGMRAAVPAMIESGGGSIVNISSIGGLRGTRSGHAYTASKFGLRGLTKSVADEYAAQGIRANSVHPGVISTEMTADMVNNLRPGQLGIPMLRYGEIDEVSQVVVFLASDMSSYCTGGEFVVDGGMTAINTGPAIAMLETYESLNNA